MDPEAHSRNQEIERQLKKDKAEAKKQVNILLLGAGESGKSTVLKQMKLMYDGEYTDQERLAYKEIIFANVVQCMSVVLQSLDTLGLAIQPANESSAEVVTNTDQSFLEQEYLSAPLSEALLKLWRDPAVVLAVRRSKEFQLNDSATYFFDAVERFSSPGYMPTNQDILRSRVKTTGITETTFHVQGLDYRVMDVGGQRSERRKWIHCFENVTALIFIVSLSEYDQVLYEDETVNRMAEALTLFDAVANSRWFTKSSIILFLNKIDLLQEKMRTRATPIREIFEDYTGPDDGSDADFNHACEYFRRLFLARNQNNHKRLITHLTCATDTNQIKVVIQTVNEHILKTQLEEVGFV
ncbi:guanine nucleotide-binding protein subunit alpha [Tulasnella sp. 424]|nr:guanine nucleotide-binding protein subunit alpha [Tulasnella sp. 424]